MSNSEREMDVMKTLPVDVALAIATIDREINRRVGTEFESQGGMLRLTDTQYLAMRNHILGHGKG